MKRRSIRWQLPLSYASVALVAALSLTLILLTVLRSYYTSQELSYLENNARAAAELVVRELNRSDNLIRVNGQLRGLAFFSDTRIQLIGPNQELVADSGEPTQYWLRFAGDGEQVASLEVAARGSAIVESATAPDPVNSILYLNNADTFVAADLPNITIVDTLIEQQGNSNSGVAIHELLNGDETSGTIELSFPRQIETLEEDVRRGPNEPPGDFVPLDRTLYGINVSSNALSDGQGPRSHNEIAWTVFDGAHQPVGTIVVSDGPAYGTEIINTVLDAGIFAGGFSVLIAAFVGWIMSRRLTQPLLALTDATTRMASGDLSVRTQVHRHDELGKLSTSFNHMAERIENTVSALRLFVADAAHELHTPLTALRTNLELALESNGGAASERALQQVARLQSLADSLLDLSRIEAQSGIEQPELIDLNPIINELSAIYASEADQREVDFILNLPRCPVQVSGDRVQLQRLIGNLLDNAVKFTSGGTVTVNLHHDAADAFVRVNDTGIGIPEDELPHLFERFRRGRNTSNYPGSGLGLAIAKAIVTAHGGTISAQSNGTGTTMTVKLPLAERDR